MCNSCNNTDNTDKLVDIWELAGCGKAPFKIVGFYSIPTVQTAIFTIDRPVGYACGICDVCGISLVHNVLVKSACGRTFSVGMDCAKKHGNVKLFNAAKEAKKEQARIEREALRKANYEAKLQEQRSANGGLTDDELHEKAMQEAKAAKVDAKSTIVPQIEEILEPLMTAISGKSGGFINSLSSDIQSGNMDSLTTGMIRIAIDIQAKELARRSSGKTRGKLFNEAMETAKVESKNKMVEALTLHAEICKHDNHNSLMVLEGLVERI